MITRQYIVDFARSYKGVPYRHQGRSVAGLDCAGILVLLGEEIGFYSEKIESRRYSRNPASFKLKQEMDKHLIPISKQDIQVGDVLLLKITTDPQHIGIVTGYSAQSFGMIHCYDTVGRVVEHRLNRLWFERIIQSYSIPGVK